jgi:predicted DsbA family dithiol-disulfide isomerase
VGSCTLARAGIAAGKQDRFWYYHDLLFANQHLWKSGVSPTQLVGLAAKTGFDAEAFESELDSEEALDRVRADVEEAHTLGVEETPVLFVNGRRMEALPVSEFLEELLRQEAESKRPFSIPESVRAESMVAQGQRSTP